MKLVRVGAAVLNQTPLDWDRNTANITAAIEEARAAGVTILCLPEMCVTGYGCEDAFHAPHVYETAWEILRDEIRPLTRGMVVSVGLPLRFNNGFYNAAAMLVDGVLLGFVCKQHLAGDGIHYEPRWFKAWPSGMVATLHRDGEAYPIGDIHFEVGGVRIGFEICEDAWAAHRPGSELSTKGIDMILNPSASHFAFGKFEVRKRFVLEGSRAFGVTYVYANLLGNEAGRAIYDGGAIIAASGQIVTTGPRLSFAPWVVTSAVIDIERTRVDRARTVSHRPAVDARLDDRVRVDFDFPAVAPTPNPDFGSPWESAPHRKEEEFTRAMSLALLDYLQKSWSRGFVVSLSGGADSSAVATLVTLAVELGAAELGWAEFQRRFAYIDGVQAASTPREAIASLLTCAYQATRNSGEVTEHAAATLASALGATYHRLDVDALVQGYRAMVEDAIGRPLSWETDDITLQNIQARVRAPSVWMFANLEGKLLLATSNRSEAAVGYATMDGDTAGGLSPIAGVDKVFLRQWLRWMEQHGPYGRGALAALDVVNAQQPTAELRPPQDGQTDEGDLMPYHVLDVIERAFIRDKRSPAETLLLLRTQFSDVPDAQRRAWVDRFFRLWCRNQWKRERYAPSFHLDDENLDPKTWCRFPILSGGYRRELAAIAADTEKDG